MNRPLSQILNDLTGYAGNLVATPLYSAVNANIDFAQLAAEVRAAEARPAVGTRATYGAIIVVNAIEAWRASAGEVGSPWLMLVGTALPLLRTDAWLALNQEKAQATETRR
jgi:hypothetical protein